MHSLLVSPSSCPVRPGLLLERTKTQTTRPIHRPQNRAPPPRTSTEALDLIQNIRTLINHPVEGWRRFGSNALLMCLSPGGGSPKQHVRRPRPAWLPWGPPVPRRPMRPKAQLHDLPASLLALACTSVVARAEAWLRRRWADEGRERYRPRGLRSAEAAPRWCLAAYPSQGGRLSYISFDLYVFCPQRS